MSESVVRFSLRQRLEHAAVMVLFVTLALTGFPQKYPDAGLGAAPGGPHGRPGRVPAGCTGQPASPSRC